MSLNEPGPDDRLPFFTFDLIPFLLDVPPDTQPVYAPNSYLDESGFKCGVYAEAIHVLLSAEANIFSLDPSQINLEALVAQLGSRAALEYIYGESQWRYRYSVGLAVRLFALHNIDPLDYEGELNGTHGLTAPLEWLPKPAFKLTSDANWPALGSPALNDDLQRRLRLLTLSVCSRARRLHPYEGTGNPLLDAPTRIYRLFTALALHLSPEAALPFAGITDHWARTWAQQNTDLDKLAHEGIRAATSLGLYEAHGMIIGGSAGRGKAVLSLIERRYPAQYSPIRLQIEDNSRTVRPQDLTQEELDALYLDALLPCELEAIVTKAKSVKQLTTKGNISE